MIASSLGILVVEDDADTRANLCDILELDDHRVQSAATAAEALARRDWDEMSVIILDRKLPDGTAEELLPKLLVLSPAAAVIVVTGFADVEGAIAALRQGAADYLLKPINPDALRKSINRIAVTKRAERELRIHTEQQSIVAEIGQRALQSIRLPELMDEVVDRVAAALKVEFSRILELLPGGKTLRLRAGYGWPRELVRQVQIPVGAETQACLTVQTRSPVVLEDLRTDSRFRGAIYLHQRGIVSGVCVAIHGEKHPFGTVGVHSVRKREFSQSDINFLQAIANVLAAAIERSRTEERAMQAERLAAIGQMVAGLAHESRNALQRSQACLEMLALELEDRPDALQLVSRVQRAQDHLHHLYEEVRGYAAPIHLKRQPVDLRTVWRDTWAHLELARKEKVVALEERIDTSDCVCAADRHALEQVFRNILENAIVACPASGRVEVVAEDTIHEGRPALQVTIGDNGSGMTVEQRERIFEPFYTTKTQGTGLGMAIAKRIVEAHGGTIRVGESARPGTELVVTLPRATP